MSKGADDIVLEMQRRRIDALDGRIVALLGERIATVRDVIALKERHGIAARLPDRVEAVVVNVRAEAERQHCPPDLAEAVWRTIIAWTIAFEEQAMLAWSAPDGGQLAPTAVDGPDSGSQGTASSGRSEGAVSAGPGLDLTDPATRDHEQGRP